MSTDKLTNRASPVVELEGISKSFPGVKANDSISLSFYPGEVHGLLGENGAGKSTLMSILSGMHRPDSGIIKIDGQPVDIDSPKKAIDLGIGMVYQHVTLSLALQVVENLMLGSNPGIRLRRDVAIRRLSKLADSLGVTVKPDVPAGSLALGQQQQVEIIKALWRDSRVLILDEPTSMLTPQGVEELEKVLVRLKSQGLSVIFITHKLHEAISMGDRVSFLRQGRVVGSLSPDELGSRTPDELQSLIIQSMFGEEAPLAAEEPEMQPEVESHVPAIEDERAIGDVFLELTALSAEGGSLDEVGIHDVNLTVAKGEILGIAGVDGNGQGILAQTIAGQIVAEAGEIKIEGRSITRLSVSARERLGIRYVTDDGLGEGVVPSLSVGLNLVLKRIGQAPFWQRGTIRMSEIDRMGEELIKQFDIRTPSVRTRAGTLSGGNLRKLILARELAMDPRMVIYNKPTYGLDVKTTHAVRTHIREQARRGLSAVVISTDLEELLDMCDRVAVMLDGRITGVVENRASTDIEEEVGELMVGVQKR